MSATPTPPFAPLPPLGPETGPALASVLAMFGGAMPPIHAGTLAASRAYWPDSPAALLANGDFAHDEHLVVGRSGNEIALSVFRPTSCPPDAPAVFFVHGGGLVVGNRFALDGAEEICREAGLVLVSPEYRLAPEHPYPAALDDCHDAFLWTVGQAATLGIDPGKLFLGGSSAGGCLAAALAIRLRDRGDHRPVGLQLTCPMLDDRMTLPSSFQCAEGFVWTRESNTFGWSSYLAGCDPAGVPDEAVPGRATDLRGLPPTLIDVGTHDLFRDEDVAFASTLGASGVICELHLWAGGYHGSDALAPDAAVTQSAKAARVDWYRRRLRELAEPVTR